MTFLVVNSESRTKADKGVGGCNIEEMTNGRSRKESAGCCEDGVLARVIFASVCDLQERIGAKKRGNRLLLLNSVRNHCRLITKDKITRSARS